LVMLFVPVTVLMILSGFLFDPILGFVLASLILIGGTSAGFVGGRVLWPRIQHFRVFQSPLFQSIRKAVDQEGTRLIAFLRMTPFFHFMSGNLFFGSLNIRFLPYLAYSYIGMVPGTALVVVAGSVANSDSDTSGEVMLGRWVLFVLGLLVFTGVSWRITRVTRKILSENRSE
jgi:phospholipase D1/2